MSERIYNIDDDIPIGIKKMTFNFPPEGVDERFFSQFTDLKNIELINNNFLSPNTESPNDTNIAQISPSAFEQCRKLETVKIGEGFNHIGDGAFNGCVMLKEIVLPDSILEIDNSAFLGCRMLNKINLPDNITKIGVSAFMGCYN